jgi:hypothetical protein
MLPKKLIVEGNKSIEIKKTINDLIDYLIAKEEVESRKVEESNPVNMHRMTVQTATLPVEDIIEPDVVVGTVEEVSDKLVKIKRERGWEYVLKATLKKE